MISDRSELDLRDLESKFSRTRQQLFDKVNSYYNQSIGSNYNKESDIRRLLNQCEEIKQEYQRIQAEIMRKRSGPEYNYSNFVFSKQFEHEERNNNG